MKKNVFIIVIVAFMIGGIFMYTQSNSNHLDEDTYNVDKIEMIENQWNLQFPDSKTLIYQKSTARGFHGDNVKYFLFDLHNSEQSYFVDYLKEPSVELENEISQLLSTSQYDEQYIPEFDKGYHYQKLSRNDFQQLYLIVSTDLLKLYVIENKI